MKINKKRLQLLMMKNCMTTEALAKAAGIGVATVNILLHHERRTLPVTIGKVAKALNVNPEELIEEET